MFAINGKAIIVPSGYSKVRSVIDPEDLAHEPSTDSWVEVRTFRPDWAGQDNHELRAPVIRANERF